MAYPRVLLIENDKAQQEKIVESLTNKFLVTAVSTLEEAIEVLSSKHGEGFHVLITEMELEDKAAKKHASAEWLQDYLSEHNIPTIFIASGSQSINQDTWDLAKNSIRLPDENYLEFKQKVLDAISEATKSKTLKIFVSYNHNDRGYVQKLQESLHERGFDVWFDGLIGYGENWAESIEKNLETCDIVLAILTPRSASSHTFMDEIKRAESLQKKIIPILLQDVEENPLTQLKYVDVRGGKLPPKTFYQQLESFSLHGRLAGDSTTDAPSPKGKKKGKR